jgi:hypothetical protein
LLFLISRFYLAFSFVFFLCRKFTKFISIFHSTAIFCQMAHNVLQIGAGRDFYHWTSYEGLNSNLPLYCPTKHESPAWAYLLLWAGFLRSNETKIKKKGELSNITVRLIAKLRLWAGFIYGSFLNYNILFRLPIWNIIFIFICKIPHKKSNYINCPTYS